MIQNVLALGILLFMIPAFSSVGFNPSNKELPPQIQKYWNSVFLFQHPTRYGSKVKTVNGTASIVGKRGDRIYFLTAYHVVESSCTQMGRCNKNAILLQNNTLVKAKYKTPSSRVTIRNFNLISVDKINDLAILSVDSKKMTLFKDLFPIISTAKDCLNNNERSYSIGYPQLSLRYSKPINLTKTWNTGVAYSGNLNNVVINGKYGNTAMRATSNDALPGNSGGPVINSKGELVGATLMARALNGGHGPNAWKADYKTKYRSAISKCKITKSIIQASINGGNPGPYSPENGGYNYGRQASL